MLEHIIIGAIFLLALAYLGNIVWKQFRIKKADGCAKGCGCSASSASGLAKIIAERKEAQAKQVEATRSNA